MEYIIDGIPIQIDEEDVWVLRAYCWSFQKNGYLQATIATGKHTTLHRFLMNPKELEEVDHKDGIKTNYLKSNLRVCTHLQNQASKTKKRNSRSKYKGLGWDSKHSRWKVYCRGKYLGDFYSEIEAAKVYNEAAKREFGEFAKLNIIEEIQ